MLIASAVLPMLGRAARITSSESCRPPVSSSKSMKPVSRPPRRVALHAGIDAGERFVQHVADRADLRVAFGIEDAEDALFGAGQHFAGVDAGFVRFLDDVGAGVDQRAEDGLVADDAGVVLGMGGGGDFLAQLEQEGGAADRFVLAGILSSWPSSVGSICRPPSCRASMWPKIARWAPS